MFLFPDLFSAWLCRHRPSAMLPPRRHRPSVALRRQPSAARSPGSSAFSMKCHVASTVMVAPPPVMGGVLRRRSYFDDAGCKILDLMRWGVVGLWMLDSGLG
ncbi:hypothetical protein Dimus_036668 [Dionaea muscipula]